MSTQKYVLCVTCNLERTCHRFYMDSWSMASVNKIPCLAILLPWWVPEVFLEKKHFFYSCENREVRVCSFFVVK